MQSKLNQDKNPSFLTQNLKPVFELFDREVKNYIDENDLMLVMFAYGFHPTKSEVKSLIGNKNGKLDFDGFVKLFQKNINSGLLKKEMFKSFKVFDKDGDGFISRDEVGDMLKLFVERPSDEYIDEFLQEADLNDDGQIDFSEFVALFEA